MSGILDKYDAIRKAHDLPVLVAAKLWRMRLGNLTKSDVETCLETFAPTCGWCAIVGKAPEIVALRTREDRPKLTLEEGKRLLEGEFSNGAASLAVSVDHDASTITILTEDESRLPSFGERATTTVIENLLRERVYFATTDAVNERWEVAYRLSYDLYWDYASARAEGDIGRRRRARFQSFAGFTPTGQTTGTKNG